MFDKHVSLMMFSKLSLHFKPTQKTKPKKTLYIYIYSIYTYICLTAFFLSNVPFWFKRRLCPTTGSSMTLVTWPRGPLFAWDFSSESHPANQRCLRLVWRWEKSPEPILNARLNWATHRKHSPLIKDGQLGNPPTSHGGLVRWENHPSQWGITCRVFWCITFRAVRAHAFTSFLTP